MAITYGFFNSMGGDRTYNADQMSEYFSGLISDGVFENVGDALQVIPGDGMTAKVKSGRAIIKCKWLENDAVETLSLNASHPTLDRYSAVVVRLDASNRLMEFAIKDGTAASSPAKPSMTNDSSVSEMCLAYIKVKAGTTAITAADIQDMRASSLCGWVTGLIKQVDTSTLFEQYTAAYTAMLADMQAWMDNQEEIFSRWFSTLTSNLVVNAHNVRYYADYAVETDTNYIPLDSGLNYEDGDIIDVYINGIMLSPTKWSLSKSGDDYSIETEDQIEAGNVVNIINLKSVIGNPGQGSYITKYSFSNFIDSNTTLEEV